MTAVKICRNCKFFEINPAMIEGGIPGIATLSSAHGASRTGDGLCGLHDRYLRETATCGAFEEKERRY